MKNETEKLNEFKLAVFSRAQQQAQDIISQAKAQQEDLLNAAKQETQSSVNSQLEAIDKQYAQNKVRSVSSHKLQAQRNVLRHRNEMINRVFENVCKRLEDLCKSEEYEQLLKARLDKCAKYLNGSGGIAYFAKRDLELGRELCKAFGFTAQQSQNISLGGVTVVCEQTGIALDCTFDSALEQEKQDFSKTAGLA